MFVGDVIPRKGMIIAPACHNQRIQPERENAGCYRCRDVVLVLFMKFPVTGDLEALFLLSSLRCIHSLRDHPLAPAQLL